MTRRRTPTVLITAATLLFGLAIAAGAAGVSSPNQKAAQAKPPAASPAPADDPAAGVEVTALALEPTKFCKYGSDAYLVYIPIDITVVNGRRAPIILARALRVQRALLGKTNDDVQAGRFELATPVTKARLRGDPIMFGPAPEEDDFTVLKHNQKFETTVVQGIPVRNNAATQVPGTAYPGSLAFSVELQTWPFVKETANLQQQWVRFGDLIVTPVQAYPTIIRLPASPPAENCGIRR